MITFSIIIVTYNAEKTLSDTLDSISRQTFSDYEIVAVDGASTDQTISVFQKYKSKIGTLISEPDSGVYNAMNKGIQAARGKYVMFLNAQDTFYSEDVLSVVAEELKTSEADLLCGDIYFTNKEEIPEADLWETPNSTKTFEHALDGDFSLCHQAVFYRRDLLLKLNGYDESFRIYADWDCNLRALFLPGFKYHYLHKTIANFDLGGISTRRRKDLTDIQMTERLRCIQLNARRYLERPLRLKPFALAKVMVLSLLHTLSSKWEEIYANYIGMNMLPCTFSFQSDIQENGMISRADHFLGCEPCGSWMDENGGFSFFLWEKKPKENYLLDLQVMSLCTSVNPHIRTCIYVNDHFIGMLNGTEVPEQHPITKFELPGKFLHFDGRKENRIRFISSGLFTPFFSGLGSDIRRLGFGLVNACLFGIDGTLLPRLPRGGKIDFSAPDIPALLSGGYEQLPNGMWISPNLSAAFAVDPVGIQENLACELQISYVHFLPRQKISLQLNVNGQKICSRESSDSAEEIICFEIPVEIMKERQGMISLELLSTGFVSPMEANPSSQDTRPLGILLRSISFK